MATVRNTKYKDNAAKLVFGDPILCAQFLKDYVDREIFRNVTPDDIEDISERFLPLFQEGRDADTVKKIRLHENNTAFLVTLLEHQSKVDYTTCMKILRYFVFIWTDYEKEMERLAPGSTRLKGFRLPPIVPVIYYEGTGSWTAATQFKDVVLMNDTFSKYIPNFTYEVVALRDYEDSELIAKEDEISLLMLFNKMLTSEDFAKMQTLPPSYLNMLQNKTPDYLLQLIGKIVSVFLYRINVPKAEVETITDKITRRDFDMMFDCFEEYDVQALRKQYKEEGIAEGIATGFAESILNLLSDLAPVPASLDGIIREEQDISVLRTWVKKAAKSSSIDDFLQQTGLK